MAPRTKQVRKLIIPLAGFGTRFLPTSKNYPKEMINLVDRPVIQYIVEEAHGAGIREIIFVVNYSKDVIADYFSAYQHPHQRRAYKDSKVAHENLQALNRLLKDIKFRTVKKTTTLGDGHSILFAAAHIGKDEPFAVSMGDLLSPPNKNFLQELITEYKKVNAPVVSVESVAKEKVSKYGVIAPRNSEGPRHEVASIVEKPAIEKAPSTLILTGKYILTPAIFPYLKSHVRKGGKGEVRLADALHAYALNQKLYAYACSGKIQDTGNKFDFLRATVNFGLEHPEFGPAFKDFLRKV